MPEPLTEPGQAGPGERAPWLPVLAALVAYALVGLVARLVWEPVWNAPTQQVQDHAVYYVDYESLRRVFTGTGLYAVVGFVASAATALVVCLLTRRRELVTLLTVVVGSAIAAGVMWKTGVTLGPADPTAVAAHAANGTKVSGPLQVSGHSPYLVWPMASLLVLSLVFFGSPGPAHLPRRRSGAGTAHGSADPVEAGVSDPSRG
jgi:hypothetical protein